MSSKRVSIDRCTSSLQAIEQSLIVEGCWSSAIPQGFLPEKITNKKIKSNNHEFCQQRYYLVQKVELIMSLPHFCTVMYQKGNAAGLTTTRVVRGIREEC